MIICSFLLFFMDVFQQCILDLFVLAKILVWFIFLPFLFTLEKKVQLKEQAYTDDTVNHYIFVVCQY